VSTTVSIESIEDVLRGKEGPDASDLPFRFEFVHRDRLLIDKKYQRPLTSFADKIGEQYSPLLATVLVVSERPGKKYAIVDGQHRFEGGKQDGIQWFPCFVISGLARDDEASLFARFQTERRQMKAIDRFLADLRGNPNTPEGRQARDIDSIVRRNGFRMARGGTSKTTIRTPSAIEYLYRYDNTKAKMDGPEALDRTLSIIYKVWKNEDKNTNRAIVTGIGNLYLRNGDKVDDEWLISQLRDFTPARILTMAGDIKHGRGVSSGKYREGDAVYRTLLKMYNRGVGGKGGGKGRKLHYRGPLIGRPKKIA